MAFVKPDRQGRKPAAGPRGGVFFSMGFRPFFLSAALLAVLAIAIWVLALRGVTLVQPAHGMMLWHIHEMVFGYGSAVLTGFLLTALPNWTGRRPVSGPALIGLFALWLAGRVVMLVPVGPEAVAGVIEAAFLPVLALLAAREIVGGRNWRNLMVLGPVVVLAAANILFHVEAAWSGTSEYGTRLGLAALALLVMLIGGRIVPAFSRNWLAQQGAARLPVMFARFDGICLIASALALGLWVAMPFGPVTGAGLGVVGVLHIVRLSRWAGLATRGNAILFVLHVAYGMIPASLLLLALAGMAEDPAMETAGLHLLGIGAIGGMTMSVMMRASIGHTGRALRADIWLKAALILLFGAAFVRVTAAFLPGSGWVIDLAALLWIAAFLLFLGRIGPWLVSPRLSGNSG